jgi:hypothetical protein
MWAEAEGCSISATEQRKIGFNGRNITFEGIGYVYLNLRNDHNGGEIEHYLGTKATLIVCNLIMGKTYVDIAGTPELTCQETGFKAKFKFSRRGIKQDSWYKFEFEIVDPYG